MRFPPGSKVGTPPEKNPLPNVKGSLWWTPGALMATQNDQGANASPENPGRANYDELTWK